MRINAGNPVFQYNITIVSLGAVISSYAYTKPEPHEQDDDSAGEEPRADDNLLGPVLLGAPAPLT